MSEHRITLDWSRKGGPFERNNYSNDHLVKFQGGQAINVSSAASFGGNAVHADPEQLLLAALSSCHMLTFLAVAANRGYVVDEYADDAEAELGKDEQARTFVTQATLRPRVHFSGSNLPSAEDYAKLHERAHRACFIANSVKTQIKIEFSLG